MLFIIFLLHVISIVYANYNYDLVYSALNISQSSYCMSNLDEWSCATCTNDNVYETKIIHESELAIIGYNKQYNSLFVGFRGSSNIQNWLDNLQIKQITPYDNKLIAVDDGFYKIYNALKNDLYTHLNKFVTKYNTNDVLLTGHSLGAAIATLFAFDFCYYTQPYHVYSLITFGSPRVGNNDFSNYMHGCNISSTRVTHYYDVVPHVPEELLGYKHVSHEIWYDRPNTLYTECNDTYDEDPSCSNSCAPFHCTSVNDHLNYLNISMGNDGLC